MDKSLVNAIDAMLQPRWGLGPLSAVLIGTLTLVVASAAISLVRNPPRHTLLTWPASFVLVYVFSVVPLVGLLSAAHSPSVEGINAMAGIILVALTLVIVRRPNRLAFLALAAALLFFWIRYAVALWDAANGYLLATLASMLTRPVLIATLVGQGAELIAATLFAALAIGRPDLFRKPAKADVF